MCVNIDLICTCHVKKWRVLLSFVTFGAQFHPLSGMTCTFGYFDRYEDYSKHVLTWNGDLSAFLSLINDMELTLSDFDGVDVT